jgi:hypothetical protein
VASQEKLGRPDELFSHSWDFVVTSWLEFWWMGTIWDGKVCSGHPAITYITILLLTSRVWHQPSWLDLFPRPLKSSKLCVSSLDHKEIKVQKHTPILSKHEREVGCSNLPASVQYGEQFYPKLAASC